MNAVLKRHRKEVLSVFLVLLTLGTQLFIFSFSLKDGEASSAQSNAVIEVVGPSVEQLLPVVNVDPSEENIVIFVRKLGHFSEFALLGLITCFAVYSLTKKKKVVPFAAWGYCILTAFADERIQLSSDGRAGRLTDVLIDSAGALAGILFAMLCLCIFRRICRRYARPKEILSD